MATISVFLQSPIEAADHVLYGWVNSATGSGASQVVVVNSNGGGSGTTTPFIADAVGKVIRRYTAAQWNAQERLRPSAVLTADTGVISTVPSVLSFTSTITSTWAQYDIWAIDFHNSSGGFRKWSDEDKGDEVAGTADEESPSTNPGTTEGLLPLNHSTKAPDPFGNNGEQDMDPGTTKWELRCDQISRNYNNAAIPLPLPSIGEGDQYYNMILDIGMRQETINLQGTLVDRGVPTASNPRLQTIFDLIRTQHVTLLNTTGASQGGEGAVPSNPRAYMRITIGSGYEPSDYIESVGSTVTNPEYDLNTNLIVRDRNYTIGETALGAERTTKTYRGMITSFNATLTGGRPDIWTWQMTFSIVKNEHDWTFFPSSS